MSYEWKIERGMDLLDYFAGKALAGGVIKVFLRSESAETSEALAECCYDLAEAMLRERQKRTDKAKNNQPKGDVA
jgi:hypothetical protein